MILEERMVVKIFSGCSEKSDPQAALGIPREWAVQFVLLANSRSLGSAATRFMKASVM